jgi:hypothetical protein
MKLRLNGVFEEAEKKGMKKKEFRWQREKKFFF